MFKIKERSFLMKFFDSFGLKKISWSLRRLHCPIPKNFLVLEIGSGGNPYYRSNVLIDKYLDTKERHWVPLVKDRKVILGSGEYLPFKNKSFDFIVASHVLEHSIEPELFIKELMRVGNSGYIETPHAFFERINPYDDHRSEIYFRDNTLFIKKKSNSIEDKELNFLYEHKSKKIMSKKVIPSNPEVFHTRIYWNKKINYKILNPNQISSWKINSSVDDHLFHITLRAKFAKYFLFIVRYIFSQRKRNNTIDIKQLLACPECKKNKLYFGYQTIYCHQCDKKYSHSDGIPNLNPLL